MMDSGFLSFCFCFVRVSSSRNERNVANENKFLPYHNPRENPLRSQIPKRVEEVLKIPLLDLFLILLVPILQSLLIGGYSTKLLYSTLSVHANQTESIDHETDRTTIDTIHDAPVVPQR
jgi:hypothetical protein